MGLCDLDHGVVFVGFVLGFEDFLEVLEAFVGELGVLTLVLGSCVDSGHFLD